jgi:hypothetical protein
VSLSKPSFVGFNSPTASDGLFLSITLVLPVKMEYVYKRLPLTNSFPKETPPLDKDRILGIAKSSGLENPDFTSAVNYLRGEGAQSTCWSLPPVPKQVLFFYLFFIHQVWVKSILL